ncbi:MAG: hypothetical protein MZV63_59045 [Marinilabiliales bacterium]|nr:hypothetical protein [Marinilabiliales bacterium]
MLTPITHSTTRASWHRITDRVAIRSHCSMGEQCYHHYRHSHSVRIFSYTVPLTGGCGTVNATGTVRSLRPIPLVQLRQHDTVHRYDAANHARYDRASWDKRT